MARADWRVHTRTGIPPSGQRQQDRILAISCSDSGYQALRVFLQAVQTGRVRLYGQDQDVCALVHAAKQQLLERLHAENHRQLGLGAELDRVLFVGGGAVTLAPSIRDWFPNQAVAEHPAFANARGMLKCLLNVLLVPSKDMRHLFELSDELAFGEPDHWCEAKYGL